ncbi:hypothetical protein PINS_up013904 [Pythium insidiosum]|nr:hypothetical protein PINS_up013904 [Pythium insidiosum]
MDALGRFSGDVSLAAPAFDGFRGNAEWDDAAFDNMNFELDLGFDTFLMATADDFMEPLSLTATTPPPTEDAVMTPSDFFSEPLDMSCTSESEASVSDEDPVSPVLEPAAKRSRKRKIPEVAPFKPQTVTPKAAAEKKAKGKAQIKRDVVSANPEIERVYRRRYDILHEILEAWNTGGIEDMEEIADDVYHSDVTLISPDYSEGLKGVKAIMEHWALLLDAFPDGIMEEYNIERDDPEGQKMNVSWVFSGTQIFPFFGVEPRHEKVTIRGQSFFTFKGEKISQMVLSWNYREALMKLMGVSASDAAARR